MKHFNALANFSNNPLKIDRENGIIRGISIVEKGKNKNNTYFSQTYLEALAIGANEQKQGVKSRFGHPNMCGSSIGDFIGRYKNFSVEGEKVVADLHLDDATKELKVNDGMTMFNYLMHMAEKNADMFGNSIHIPSAVYEKEQVEIDGVKYNSHIYNGIVASDIVDNPAATSGLFDSSDDIGVIVTKFLDDNEEVFEALIANPDLFEDFFSRYGAYYQQKNKTKVPMDIFEKIKKHFSKKEWFDVEWTLATGETIDVITESQEPQVGDEVKKKDGTPLSDGDHVDKDGKTIKVESGKIASIEDPSDDGDGDGDDTPPTNAEVMQAVNDLGEQFKTFTTFMTKANTYFDNNDKALEEVLKGHQAMETKFENLAKGVGSDFNPDGDDGDPNTPPGGEKNRTVTRKKD